MSCLEVGILLTTLSADGSVSHEVARRIGIARSDFASLKRVWRRSGLSCRRKLSIFGALIESKVLYGLATCCLNVSQQRRLNGFQCRCLRDILGIAPAYFSRISNKEVLSRAHCRPLTDTLLDQQLGILGRALRASPSAPIRSCAFVAETDWPLVAHYVRRVGRPRKEWAPTILCAAHSRNSTRSSPHQLARDAATWRQQMFQRSR